MSRKVYVDARICYREDTLENWQTNNPILERGEPSVVRDPIKEGEWFKVGDGVTAWNDLPWKKTVDTNAVKALVLANEPNNNMKFNDENNVVGYKGYKLKSVTPVNDNTVEVVLDDGKLTEKAHAHYQTGDLVNIEASMPWYQKYKINDIRPDDGGTVLTLEQAEEGDFSFELRRESNLANWLWVTGKPFGEDILIFSYAIAGGLRNEAIGGGALTVGVENKAHGNYSVAFGRLNFAGFGSFAIGIENIAKGLRSFVSGHKTLASGTGASTFGYGTQAIGDCSFAKGSGTKALGECSHTQGTLTTASGLDSFAGGLGSQALAENATAIGNYVTADGKNSFAVGEYTHAQGEHSTAIGRDTLASGNASFAGGQGSIAKGKNSFAIGGYGNNGIGAQANGEASFACGSGTEAKDTATAAFGRDTKALAAKAVAMGTTTTASGDSALATGTSTVASGVNSFTQGWLTKATAWCQAVFGRCNAVDDNALLIVGDGDGDGARSNAFTVYKDSIKVGNTVITEAQIKQLLALLN